MESSIILLSDHTDQATKQMLQNVVDRKKKFERLEKKHRNVLWLTIITAASFIIYLYLNIINPYSYSFYEMFSRFVNEFNHVFLLICTIGLYGYLTIIQKKVDKAEKEYQLLRCEIVSKSKVLWEDETAWKNRHHVFDMMKREFDINLYNENK